MNPRLRKFIGMFVFLGGLAFYCIAIAVISLWLPKEPWFTLPFYIFAGVAWVPLFVKLVRWMEYGSTSGPSAD